MTNDTAVQMLLKKGRLQRIAESLLPVSITKPSWQSEHTDIINFARVLQDKIDAYTSHEAVDNIALEYLQRYRIEFSVEPQSSYPPSVKRIRFSDKALRQGDLELSAIGADGFDEFIIYNATHHNDETITRLDKICSCFGLRRDYTAEGFDLKDMRNLKSVASSRIVDYTDDVKVEGRERGRIVYSRPKVCVSQTFMRHGEPMERELLYSIARVVYDASIGAVEPSKRP